MKISIKAFKAIDYSDICEMFIFGHVKVLTDYGIQNVTTNNRKWIKMPNVYIVVAFNEDQTKLLGGVRIHIADGKERLPLENAIGKMDERIYEIIKSHQAIGTGEICGLWNSKEVSGRGISLLLIRAGISIVNQIKLGSLFTICADYTMPMVKRVGFTVEKSIGKNGEFVYPNENYIARVLKKLNAVTLELAEELDKDRIFNLRECPIQIFNEIGLKEDIAVDYNLIISNLVK